TLLLSAAIDETRRAERTVRESEERMALTASSANIGLWQYSIGTRRFWATEHCRYLFGLPANSPLTREALLAAIHPDDAAIAAGTLRAGKGWPAPSEFRVVLSNGEMRWLGARGQLRLDENGKATEISGFITDITDLKRAEAQA